MTKIQTKLKPVALVSGITGQDAYYLSKFLLDKNYEIYGMYRRNSTDINERLIDLKDEINLVDGDLTDTSSLVRILNKTKPDEIYNLAAQSFVPESWTQPIASADITGTGVLRMLEAIRLTNKDVKFYQACSSEMFGKVQDIPQTEKTKFYPRSPYGCAKVYGFDITRNYRESYDMFACSGILFNHESPKRGKQFVTRKITNTAARIKLGLQDTLELGNLDAKRDWGYAGDFVEAMYFMLQQPKPKDYVIATNETHSVREFVDEAFNLVDMPLEWEGKGLNEIGKYKDKTIVKVNPDFYRPAEVDILLGDYSKAKKELGWEPKTKFKELVKMMVESDLKLNKEGMKKC